MTRLPKISIWFVSITGAIFLQANGLFAQAPTITWGEVPRADLDYMTFSEDTNAAAVLLYDCAKVRFNGEFRLNWEQHRRIKILSQSGYDWGTIAIKYYAKSGTQRITKIEGHTIKLDERGSTQIIKLDKKQIFDEDVDREYRRVRFALPSLSPGCIIEYRYTIRSDHPAYLDDWYFQHSIPTRWSEFNIELPQVLGYGTVTHVSYPFAINESQEQSWPPDLNYFETAKQYNLKIMYHRWALRDLPAVTEEPYMTKIEDYCNSIQFQLSQIAWPGQSVIEIMTTWPKLAGSLMNSEYFGKQIQTGGMIKNQAMQLVSTISDSLEKMRKIYNFIRTTMNWSGNLSVYTDLDLEKALQLRKAGGAEINLLLVSMLRWAGLEAAPVLISTRMHGKIISAYPILSQFNHVLAYAKIGAKEYLLDSTDPLCPYDVLPIRDLNESGWLVDKQNSRWVKIVPPANYSRKSVIQTDLSPEGSIRCNVTQLDAGIFGLRSRSDLLQVKEDEYIRTKWLKPFGSASLDSFKISHRDSVDLPLQIWGSFTSSDYAQVVGDHIYFNPVLVDRSEENPFRLAKRTFPVDFASPFKSSYLLNLIIPEGFTIQETPADLKYILPNNGGEFQRMVEISSNRLQYLTQFSINKVIFPPNVYVNLRSFFDRIISAEAEPIVLRKITSAESVKGTVQ